MLHDGAAGVTGVLGGVTEVAIVRLQLKVEEILMTGGAGRKEFRATGAEVNVFADFRPLFPE